MADKREREEEEEEEAMEAREDAKRLRLSAAAAAAAGADDWSYEGGKRILAPMVRIGMLPFRLLAAEMGADMCYTEELIDRKLLQCERVVNPDGGGAGVATVDFVRDRDAAHKANRKGGRTYPVLRLVPGERAVLQIGTADATLALRAAELVARDVRAVDVNMGCPKHFSTSGGMGAALLQNPERVRDIMSTLRRNLTLPVTCKIRLLPDLRQTVELARVIERCGVSAFAVHARRREDRPRHCPLYDDVRAVKQSVGCPVILNGDCFHEEDFDRLAALTGCDSVMAARGAMWNPSIFGRRGAGTLPVWDVACRYAELSRQYGHLWKNTKYTVVAMVNRLVGKEPQFRALNQSKTEEAMHESLRALGSLPALRELPYVAHAPVYEPREGEGGEKKA